MEFPHGLSDFGIAGSIGKTLVMGGAWHGLHADARDLSGVESVLIRESGAFVPWKTLNVEQMLETLTEVKHVDVEYDDVDDLLWLRPASDKLRHIGVRCKKVKSSKPIGVQFPVLKSLDVSGQDSLLELIGPDVTTLRVWNFRAKDLNPLTSKALRKLWITTARNLVDISAVRLMHELQQFSVYAAPKLEDIHCALGHPTIEELEFRTCRQLRMPDRVDAPLNIRALVLNECDDVGTILALRHATLMDELRLTGTWVSDGNVAFLRKLPMLRTLAIQDKSHYDEHFPAGKNVIA